MLRARTRNAAFAALVAPTVLPDRSDRALVVRCTVTLRAGGLHSRGGLENALEWALRRVVAGTLPRSPNWNAASV